MKIRSALFSQVSCIFLTLPLFLWGCSTARFAHRGPGSSCEQVPFAGELQVCQFKIANGLKVLIVEDHSSPTFAYHTWFNVGSSDERVQYTGLAHLFEHMMFKGTTLYPEGTYDRTLESAGGEGINAFTSKDYTAYIQEMPASELDLIMKVEADRMQNLIVNDKSFKTEREVVQNERRFRTENNPDGMMYQTLYEIAFQTHSYRWPVIGYKEDLDRMSAEDARAFYKTYYQPSNATVVIVGDVDPDKVRKSIETHYGPLASHPVERLARQPEAPAEAPVRKTLKFAMPTEKLLVGYHTPGFLHPDTPALNLLQSLLASGQSSRLHRLLVNSGIASSVYAGESDDKDPGLFLVGVQLQKGKRAVQAESIIQSELEKIARFGVSDGELKKAKNKFKFELFKGIDTPSEKARFLGTYEIIGGSFTTGIEFMKNLDTVGSADIQRAAQTWFQSSNRAIVIGASQ